MQNFQQEIIHKAVDSLIAQQNGLSGEHQKRESTLAKWNEQIKQDIFPPDLKFKIEGYKQFPKTISEDNKNKLIRAENEIISNCRKQLFQVRIDCYEQDVQDLKNKIYDNDTKWTDALSHLLQTELTVEQKSEADEYRKNKSMLKALNEKLNPKPVSSNTNSTPMDVAEKSATEMMAEQIAQMKKEIADMKAKQSNNKNTKDDRRSKNESGSGTDTTRHQKRNGNSYHDASRSRQRSKSASSRQQNQRKEYPSKGQHKAQQRGRSPVRSQSRSQSRSSPSRSQGRKPRSKERHYQGKGKQEGGRHRSKSRQNKW